MWAENSLSVIGKEVVHHQRDRNLDDAELGAEALTAIIKELKKRLTNEL